MAERSSPDRPLVAIVGPTAVGKSEVALELAERFQGEIVSADSRQIYRGMDIGTAKPTPEERARVPHHLIDVTDPDRPLTLAEYQRMAYEAIEGIHRRGRFPQPGRASAPYGGSPRWPRKPCADLRPATTGGPDPSHR